MAERGGAMPIKETIPANSVRNFRRLVSCLITTLGLLKPNKTLPLDSITHAGSRQELLIMPISSQSGAALLLCCEEDCNASQSL
jgi:hypothetical protein